MQPRYTAIHDVQLPNCGKGPSKSQPAGETKSRRLVGDGLGDRNVKPSSIPLWLLALIES